MPSVKCSVVYASPLLFYALPTSPRAELHAPRGSGTIEINSRVYERARKPRALECCAKIGGDLCSLATRGEPLQNSYPAGSPLGLAPLPNVRGGSLFALCRAESRKGVRPRGNDTATAIFTASHPFLGYADVSPRLLTRRELAVNL